MVGFKCLNLTTLNFSATYDRDVPTCVICGGKQELHKAGSDKVDSKLPTLAQEAGDLVLFAKLQTASDAHAGDVHYHSSCYNKLSSSARSAARSKAASATAGSGYHYSFDNFAVAELAAYVVVSKNVFHVNELVCTIKRWESWKSQLPQRFTYKDLQNIWYQWLQMSWKWKGKDQAVAIWYVLLTSKLLERRWNQNMSKMSKVRELLYRRLYPSERLSYHHRQHHSLDVLRKTT